MKKLKNEVSACQRLTNHLTGFVRGLVNPSGEWSQTLYDKHGNPFVERVMPSVFENALKRGNDVKLLLEHDKTCYWLVQKMKL